MVFMKFMSNLAGIIVLAGRNSGTLFNIIQDNSICFCMVFVNLVPFCRYFYITQGFSHMWYSFLKIQAVEQIWECECVAEFQLVLI